MGHLPHLKQSAVGLHSCRLGRDHIGNIPQLRDGYHALKTGPLRPGGP